MSTQTGIVLIGLADDRFELLAPEVQRALLGAEVIVGGRRHLQLWRSWLDKAKEGTLTVFPETVEIGADLGRVASEVRRIAIDNRQRCCVLASGDPGFFGVLSALSTMIDRKRLVVYPAITSVAAAFAKVSMPWDDATVISLHERDLSQAIGTIRMARTAAVLTTTDCPPESLGRALLEAKVSADFVAVCSRLGSSNEQVHELSVDQLADGHFDPVSVVILIGPGGLTLAGWDAGGTARLAGVSGARPPAKAGLLTRAEVRAVALAKLELPMGGVVWDVGAGNGSMAIECALVAPGLQVFAVERSPEAAARISVIAHAQGAVVHVVNATAPEAFLDLPAPDRVYVGGVGIALLQAALNLLRPDGRIVAAYSSMTRAASAADLLGSLVEVSVARGERSHDGEWRLIAKNPAFIAYGPLVEDAAFDHTLDDL